MSYVKTNWETGDVVTAEKLNKMENGIASAPLTLKVTNLGAMGDNSYSGLCSTPIEDVYDAFINEREIIFVVDPEDINIERNGFLYFRPINLSGSINDNTIAMEGVFECSLIEYDSSTYKPYLLQILINYYGTDVSLFKESYVLTSKE